MDIILVNFNSTDYLLPCLESVYRDLKTRVANIFVFDNGSTDNVERVKEMYPDVYLMAGGYNMGFARAVNACIKKGNAPYIMILNPDTVIFEGFFDSVLHYMSNNGHTGIMGPKIYNQDFTVQGSARSFPTLATSLFGRNSILTRLFPNNRFTCRNILCLGAKQNIPAKVHWVSGACMLVRRQAVEDVGLLDDHFFMYWEDADWCYRMRQKGWDVLYYPDASMMHYVGGSSERNLLKSVFEFHKSVYYFYNKHYHSAFGLMKILTLMTLSVRICFVLAFHAVRRWKKCIRNNVHQARAKEVAG